MGVQPDRRAAHQTAAPKLGQDPSQDQVAQHPKSGNLIEHLACIWLAAPDYETRLAAGYEAFWVLENDSASIQEYLRLRAQIGARSQPGPGRPASQLG